MKDNTHVNIDSEVDEYELNKLDKTSLDEKEWLEQAFKIKLKYIKYIKIQNGMSCIHKKK